jgi:hypothetical protein
MSLRKIGTDERRARLARRHHLAREAQLADPVQVARDIVGYHATDPASVYLAMAARTSMAPPETLDRALYDVRLLVRMLGMRRTMFTVPTEQMPVIQAACTDAIAVKERARTVKLFADADLTPDPAGLLKELEDLAVRALEARGGSATASQLTDDVLELRGTLILAPGKPYESKTTLAPRVLFQLSAEGRTIRGRPIKSWLSNYHWALTDVWLPDGRPDAMPSAEAERELVRSWLAAFGPGTLADLKWWTGWTVTKSRKALAELGAVEVELDGGVDGSGSPAETGYVLADDLDPVPEPEPWAALLPSLDPAVMGWAMPGRDWFLGAGSRDASDERSGLYDRNGNVGPTVWWAGRVVGGWAQRRDGTIAYRLFDDIGAEGQDAIADLAGQLEVWLGDVRVSPRFPTPLDKGLSA